MVSIFQLLSGFMLTIFINIIRNGRHLFHKGPYDTKDVLNFTDWDQLTAVHREQAPGLWLHPDSPTLRYVLTIKPSKQFCGMYKNKTTCIEKTYCKWDGSVYVI